ncbi:MAG TPA: methionine synthase [Mycobacteriales bacterium]|nr:methionine synthase [Mycobacteriales bacterium]
MTVVLIRLGGMVAGAAPAGVATGVGSMPGDDVDAALGEVLEALPDLPHLPELPARGAGSDMVGRTAAQLVDLHVDLQPAGWRLVTRAGLDEARARDRLERDLDALVPALPGYDGVFKLQLAGPWTLAATLDLARGGRAVADSGAARDLVASMAEAAAAHVAEASRRLPRAQLVLQVDEPALPLVLAGALPTESGLGRIAAVDDAVVRDGLRTVVAAVDVPVVVHCCAAEPPLALLAESGAAAVSLDLAGRVDLDVVGETVERGVGLWLGVVPAMGPGVPPSVREVLEPVRALWRRLTFAPERLPASVVLTPACGLAGASSGWSRTALRLVTQAARALAEAAAEDVRA